MMKMPLLDSRPNDDFASGCAGSTQFPSLAFVVLLRLELPLSSSSGFHAFPRAPIWRIRLFPGSRSVPCTRCLLGKVPCVPRCVMACQAWGLPRRSPPRSPCWTTLVLSWCSCTPFPAQIRTSMAYTVAPPFHFPSRLILVLPISILRDESIGSSLCLGSARGVRCSSLLCAQESQSRFPTSMRLVLEMSPSNHTASL